MYWSHDDCISVKAAALGALGFDLNHYVAARTSRCDYGVVCTAPYDPRNEEHVIRKALSFTAVSGITRLDGAFWTILSKVCWSEANTMTRWYSFLFKGTVVEEKTEFAYTFSREIESKQTASFQFREKIRSYTGFKKIIHWVDEAESERKWHNSAALYC